MAGPSSLKTPRSLHIFSAKALSSSSLISMKLKTLFQTFIFSQMYRIFRPLAKAKSHLLELLGDIRFVHLVEFPMLKKNKNVIKKQKKLFFGSFRLHYNWCSSHVMPLAHASYSPSHVYCWDTVNVPTSPLAHKQMDGADELSRYLEWLEEKENQESSCNEIDKLADLFIANCHEKFRLEKQESYRRFQDMLARSV